MTKTKPCERLARAIVLRAVRDWRSAAETLREHPGNQQTMRMLGDCEEFFLSDWFVDLTSLDGGFILRKLKEEEQANDKQRIL